MKTFLILLIGVVVGGGVVWMYTENKRSGGKHTAAVKKEIQHAGDAVHDKMVSWNLTGDRIKQELDRTGQVIRRNAEAAGTAIADATADPRITAAIKAKLLADKELSAWDISVSTTDGRVTLSGNVSTPDQIGKAILLAMETDGVKEVVSTLRVKAKTAAKPS